MTADFIAFHAAERPRAIAVIVQGRVITYPELLGDVRRFTAALRDLGLTREQTLAVQCADPYCHWLILIAAEALGLVTLSLADGEDLETAVLQVPLDYIMWQQSPPRGIRAQRVSDDWLQRVLAGPAPEETAMLPPSGQGSVRITRTSGTTGEQKFLVLSRGVLDARISDWTAFYSLGRGSRCLFHMPFTVGTVHNMVAAVVQSGGTLVIEARARLWQAIAEHGITHLLVMPFSIERLVEETPSSFTKPADLRVISIGGKLSPALRQKFMARFATELTIHYGTNEVGRIASSASDDPKAHLTLHPGVEVEIVDEFDQPLPRGQAGAIRVRSRHMCAGYLHDPQATARAFRDGWFYPGDACVLHPQRQLEVIGRNDEILNIGGAKFTPSRIEEALRALAGGDDVAISTLPNADGVEEICVAITGGRLAQHAQNLAPALGALPGRIHLMPLAAIPRTESGKVRREQLRAEVLRVRRASR